eukprot:TRINITY_DN16057_c0_g1_i4.p1 TRINITY_DN16057_c0_g1~~TRINITY_DN16057_c0_g1_i4.p1  ORF type:complete len:710 (+),score=89.42 TRINITY_DN16057_c0_g1_i4:298-2130(+)
MELQTHLLNHLDENIAYSMNESIWDASFLIGLEWLPLFDNIMLICAFAINSIVQTSFAYFIWTAFSAASIDDDTIDDYHKWRLVSGHAYSYASPDNAALVERVCNLDASLTFAGSQQGVVEELSAWIHVAWDSWSPTFDVKYGAAFWLSILALTLWILTVCVELLSIKDFGLALKQLPRSSERRTLIKKSSDGLRFVTLSYGRLAFGIFIVLLRIVIGLSLLFVGGVWLMNTSSTADLILNAAALSFVIDCDELIYTYLCPKMVQIATTSLEPMPIKQDRVFVGVFKVLSLPALCFFFYLTYLSPNLELREAAYETLCGGDRMFVVGKDSLNRVFMTYHVDNMSGYEDWYEANLPAKRLATVLNEVVEGYINYNYTRTAYWIVTKEVARRLSTTTTDELVETFTCEDHEGELWQPYSALGNISIHTCADVEQYCADANPYPRANCPQVCGCENPLDGQFFMEGCPSKCQTKSTRRKQILASLPCQDSSVTDLAKQAGWAKLVSQLRVYLLRDIMDNSNKTITELMVQSLTEEGCPAIQNTHGSFMKAWHDILARVVEVEGVAFEPESMLFERMCGSPFASFCPVACRCGHKDNFAPIENLYCPAACALVL